MDVATALTAEITKRHAEVERLTSEIAALEASLRIVGAKKMTVGGSYSVPQVVASASRRVQVAEMALADGEPHRVQDLVRLAQQEAPEAKHERVRKSIHAWVSRQLAEKKLKKVGRGVYQLQS